MSKAYTELRKAAQLLLSSVKTPIRRGQAYRIGHGPLIRLEKALEAADEESKESVHTDCQLESRG